MALAVQAKKNIGGRVKDAVKKKQQEGDPKEHMPYIFSAEGYLMLFWALMLDMMGVVCAVLTLVFGIGLIFSFMVDALGMLTIGIYMWFKTKKMPVSRRWTRFAGRYGMTSVAEIIPIVGDLAFSWTIYLFMEMRK